MAARVVSFSAVLCALALAGCGDDPVEKANIGKVRAVVTQFAQSSDASACDLLTGEALVDLYGGFTSKVGPARTKCKRRARSFKGEPVKIQKAQVIDKQTAKVVALSKDGKFTYSVTVRRPHKKWLIDEISQHKVVQ